jgi:hypothetical protein
LHFAGVETQQDSYSSVHILVACASQRSGERVLGRIGSFTVVRLAQLRDRGRARGW